MEFPIEMTRKKSIILLALSFFIFSSAFAGYLIFYPAVLTSAAVFSFTLIICLEPLVSKKIRIKKWLFTLLKYISIYFVYSLICFYYLLDNPPHVLLSNLVLTVFGIVFGIFLFLFSCLLLYKLIIGLFKNESVIIIDRFGIKLNSMIFQREKILWSEIEDVYVVKVDKFESIQLKFKDPEAFKEKIAVEKNFINSWYWNHLLKKNGAVVNIVSLISNVPFEEMLRIIKEAFKQSQTS